MDSKSTLRANQGRRGFHAAIKESLGGNAVKNEQKIIQQICDGGPNMFDTFSPNIIADNFRKGASLQALIPMLRHKDPQIASAGAWIASEVIDRNYGWEIFAEISNLLYHSEPAVRFWAISSFAFLAKAENRTDLAQFISLIDDDNIGVRKQALRYLCIISEGALDGIRDIPFVKLVLHDANKDDILNNVRSENNLTRRIAIAGTVRNFGVDAEFINRVKHFLSDDERFEVEDIQDITGAKMKCLNP